MKTILFRECLTPKIVEPVAKAVASAAAKTGVARKQIKIRVK